MKNDARQPLAALAFERKGILEGRRQFILKRSPQPASGPVQAGLHGLRGDAEGAGRFLGAQTVNLPQYENFAKRRWQSVNRTLQQDANLSDRGLALRIGA